MAIKLVLSALLAASAVIAPALAGEGDDPNLPAGYASIEQISPGAFPAFPPGAIRPGGNSLFAAQSGANNALVASQTGAGSGAVAIQLGLGNQATLTQQGAGNSATLLQAGDGNTATQTQLGDGLSSTVIQFNDNNLAISEQIGTGAPPIEIIQSGSAAIAISHQGGG